MRISGTEPLSVKGVLKEQQAVRWKQYLEFETSFWRAKRQYITKQVDFFTGSSSMKSEPFFQLCFKVSV